MTNLKNRLLDEVMRVIARKFRLEICAVHKIHWHKEPGDKKFNHIDVIERDRAQQTDETKSYVREKIPVLQSFLGGHCGGYNWNPRVGDLVYVFFYHEKKGICLGNFWGWAEFPICRPTPYDICDKGGQWLKPYQDPITLDFPRQPYPPLKKPYCYRWFHGPVTGDTGKGRDWAWMLDYCHEGDAVKDCRNCLNIDSLSRDGNRGFKFYSHETESKVAHPLRDLFFNESGSFWMFDAKSCADCSECDGSCCSEMYTEGRGYWTVQGAIDYQTLRGHLRHNPYGSMDLHTETEDLPIESETSGVRVAVVSALDSCPDFAWEIKDFLTNAYAKAFKDGKIKIESPSQITLKAPTIILDGDVAVTGNHTIGGTCGHGPCSCDGSFVKIDSSTGKCMKREPTGEWACLGDKVLTSVCCQNSNNVIGCNAAGECWQWDGVEWTQLSSSPAIDKVAIGFDGGVVGLSSGSCYQWDPESESWDDISEGGVPLSEVCIYDVNWVYAVGTSDNHLYRRLVGVWGELDSTDISAISTSRDTSIFAIKLSDGSLIKYPFGASLGSATGLKKIAAKSATMVWAVGSDDKLWYWNGLTWTKSSDDTVSGIALAMM